MPTKRPKLDAATEEIARRLLSTPPKPHGDMKAARPARNKQRAPNDCASSSKPRTAQGTGQS